MVGCKTLIIITIIGIILPITIKGQEKRSLTRAQIDSIVNPKPLQGGDKLMFFSTNKINLNQIEKQDTLYSCIYTFRNQSNDTLRITEIRTTCGCTNATYSSNIIAPEESGEIELKYTPEKRSGEIDIKAYIYTNLSNTVPTNIIKLTGYVINNDRWDYLPYSMGELRIKRKRVTFEKVTRAISPSMRIVCANSGEKALKLTATEVPEFAEFRTEPQIIAPNKEGDIVITINGSKLPEDIKSPYQFTFQIEGVDAQPIEKKIKVTIENIE